jgi:uncharacterized membrane protein
MSLRFLQHVALFAAVVTTGLMAGLFFAFTTAVMPALRHGGDRTFVEAMNRISTDIQNGWFLLCFMGALLLSIAATALSLPHATRSALPWAIAGAVLYLAVIIVTGGVNIPLNNDLAKTAADTASLAQLADARHTFESRWIAWNNVRTLLNVASFVCLTMALMVSARPATSVADHAASPTRGITTAMLPAPDNR